MMKSFFITHCWLASWGSFSLAQPALPVVKSNTVSRALAVTTPAFVTNSLSWEAFNPLLWQSATTNTTWRTNGGGLIHRTNITVDTFIAVRPASNYTVLNGTNVLATTTGTLARVSFRRGTVPDFRLRVTLADRQVFNLGRFDFPTATNLAQLFVTVEGSTNLMTWTKRQGFMAFIATTNKVEEFRARLTLEPLTTNATRVYLPNTIAITNR